MSIAIGLPQGTWYPKPLHEWRLALEISPDDRAACIDWFPKGYSVRGYISLPIGSGDELTSDEIVELAAKIEESGLVDQLIEDPHDHDIEHELDKLIYRFID